MNLSLIRAIFVLSLLAVVVSGLFISVSVTTAEGTDSENTPIDMETDDDGNGIPDDFEAEYRELISSMMSVDVSSADLLDIQESETYKVLRGFYERLPIAALTKQALDQRALEFQKLAKTDSLEKQKEAIDEMLKKESELLKDDPVYAKAVEYIAAITSTDNEVNSGTNSDGMSDAKGVSEEGGVLSGQSLEGRNLPGSTSEEELEGHINQVGDMIFRDTRGGAGVSAGSDGVATSLST